jgi:hypothetical protein
MHGLGLQNILGRGCLAFDVLGSMERRRRKQRTAAQASQEQIAGHKRQHALPPAGAFGRARLSSEPGFHRESPGHVTTTLLGGYSRQVSKCGRLEKLHQAFRPILKVNGRTPPGTADSRLPLVIVPLIVKASREIRFFQRADDFWSQVFSQRARVRTKTIFPAPRRFGTLTLPRRCPRCRTVSGERCRRRPIGSGSA